MTIKEFSHIAVTLFLLIGQVNSSSLCPTAPTGSCRSDITSWSTLNAAVNSAPFGSTITLCEGTIYKTASDNKIRIDSGQIRIACQDEKKCVISGPGTHFVIRDDASVTLQALHLKDATARAVSVYSGTNTHKICNCTFSNNQFGGKGGAVAAEPSTNVVIVSSTFKNNVAFEGSAVYSRASSLVIRDSVFELNKATGSGAAIATSSSAPSNSLVLSGSVFKNNVAQKTAPGLFLYDGQWIDDGGNSAVGNTAGNGEDCNGFYSATKCFTLPPPLVSTLSSPTNVPTNPPTVTPPTVNVLNPPDPMLRPTQKPTLRPTGKPTVAPTDTYPVDNTPTGSTPSTESGANPTVCPSRPSSTSTCRTDIVNWAGLTAAVASASSGSTVILCEGTITKTQNDAKIEISGKKDIVIACPEEKVCTIKGGGGHFIFRGESTITLLGLTLEDATERSIAISSGSNQHKICGCTFFNNAFGSGKGGAVVAEWGTSVIIESSTFSKNFAFEGSAIYSRAASVYILYSTFDSNQATGSGAALAMSTSSEWLIVAKCNFYNNKASKAPVLHVQTGKFVDGGGNTGSDNVAYTDAACNGFYYSGLCSSFGATPLDALKMSLLSGTETAATPFNPSDLTSNEVFKAGVLNNWDNNLGIVVAQGLSVRLIAETGARVQLTSDRALGGPGTLSTSAFHGEPDGAAAFRLDNGWVYITNSEVDGRFGGVYALEFDRFDQVVKYETRLFGTRRNCAGGVTPWGTWVSCEEHARGQCHQIDPTGAMDPEQTSLGGPEGGNFESMEYDNRDGRRHFFVTEDHEVGPLRRFTADQVEENWHQITGTGKMEFLRFLSGNRFEWVTSKELGMESARIHYPNSEGIARDGGHLFFISKVRKMMFDLDLDNGTYTQHPTTQRLLGVNGSFQAEPDQIIDGDTGEMYFTEDGGKDAGIYVRDRDGEMCALAEAIPGHYDGDETTGFALSPDKKVLIFAIQTAGKLFAVTRDDGQPFLNINCQ